MSHSPSNTTQLDSQHHWTWKISLSIRLNCLWRNCLTVTQTQRFRDTKRFLNNCETDSITKETTSLKPGSHVLVMSSFLWATPFWWPVESHLGCFCFFWPKILGRWWGPMNGILSVCECSLSVEDTHRRCRHSNPMGKHFPHACLRLFTLQWATWRNFHHLIFDLCNVMCTKSTTQRYKKLRWRYV